MKQQQFTIESNAAIAHQVYELRLSGDAGALATPGQFVNVQVGNAYLRRPLSVAKWDDRGMTLIYKVVGSGTDWLAQQPTGARLDILTGLGTGFDLKKARKHPLLVGGGVGLPPLYQLGIELIKMGCQPRLIMGFASERDVFYQKEFEQLMPVTLMTQDGSAGGKGLVTDASLQAQDSFLYACGPIPMLKALHALPLDGQFSLEERMGCGFGACMGCTNQTAKGHRRVCHEGPVFSKEDLLW